MALNLFQGQGNGKKDPSEQGAVEYRFTVDGAQAPTPEMAAAQRKLSVLIAVLTLFMVVGFFSLINGALGRTGKNTGEEVASAYVVGNQGGNLSIVDTVPDEENAPNLSYTEAAREVLPSVVEVTVYQRNEIEPAAVVSGIIISRDGLIVTSNYALQNAQGVQVTLQNGSTYTAQIIGADTYTDLAVLRIHASNLVPATFSVSPDISIGDQVLVVGNSTSQNSATIWCVIAGTDKQISVAEGAYALNLMKINAVVGEGNAGGAVINLQGHVIGIYSGHIVHGKQEGTAFVLPFSEARMVIDDLVEFGYVKNRATLGIAVAELNETVGALNNLPEQGLYITLVQAGSPIAGHNIEAGNVVLKINGQDVTTVASYMNFLKAHKPGDTVELLVYKPETGKTVIVEVTLTQA